MKHIKLFNELNEEKSRDIVPESQVKKGMLAEDYFGELWTVEKIVPIDKFNSIKSFDESGAMSDALRDTENEIPDDTTHLIAVTNEDGESGVFCYAPEGACVWTDWEKHKKTIKESSNSTSKFMEDIKNDLIKKNFKDTKGRRPNIGDFISNEDKTIGIVKRFFKDTTPNGYRMVVDFNSDILELNPNSKFEIIQPDEKMKKFFSKITDKLVKESSNSTTMNDVPEEGVKGLFPELFEGESSESYIEKNLTELIKSCKDKIFKPGTKISNERVLGVIISKFCEFDVDKIIDVCSYALEDSNASDLANKIKTL